MHSLSPRFFSSGLAATASDDFVIEREYSAANALLPSGSLELLLGLIGCLNIEGRSYENPKTLGTPVGFVKVWSI